MSGICRRASKYTIELITGTFYICEHCVRNFHLPRELRATPDVDYIEHTSDETEKCGCVWRAH